ncbi:MAG: hypothetical protein RLZZ387_1278 [Chloroflexota bacterium]|jgi:signal peptidase I
MRTTGNALITLAIVLGICAALFFAIGPSQYGGPVTYVITRGISMEPLFKQGDLVLLRSASTYQLGDVVGFRSPQIGLVVHRIAGLEAGRFVTKGDNNAVEDFYRPEQADMVGVLWFHAPGLGTTIEQLDARLVLGIAVAIVGGLILYEWSAASGGGRHRRRRQSDLEEAGGGTSFVL